MKNNIFLKVALFIIVLVGLVVLLGKISNTPTIPDSDVVSTNGAHVHGHLSITINGKEIVIPANIGVNGVMGAGGDPMELHTHDATGIIHAEFEGRVSKEQLEIKNFFTVWGKDFSKDSILGYKADATHTIAMTINGVPSTDFEHYSITGKGTYNAGESLGTVDDIKIIYAAK